MSYEFTNCDQCGERTYLPVYERNKGLCSVCESRRQREKEWETRKLKPHVTTAQLSRLIDDSSPHGVIDALFDPACERVNFRPSAMTPGDIVVYTVWTLLGETLNGGIFQYLTNQAGSWAHHCSPSLRRIGAAKYADVIDACIADFTTKATPKEWDADLDQYAQENENPFSLLEKPFFEFYDHDDEELPSLLYIYICKNRDFFTSESE